nr:HORMA domain containing protein 2 [Hymenolepis microstoma]
MPWQKTFPLQINTETLSLVFVKKLFAVAVSNVAFVRKLFPDNAFFDKNIEGICLKILKEEASCPGTCKVVFWLRGCFDAIEKKYLRKATLALYEDPENPKTIMETFSFTFKYDGESGASMEMEADTINLPRDERVKLQTKNLLNTILTAGKMLGPLPKKMMLTMKLQYYNTAPCDYVPSGFKIDENPEMTFQNEPINLKIGEIDTDFHNVRMVVHTIPSLVVASPEKLKSAIEIIKSKTQSSHSITIKTTNISHTPRSTYQPTQPEMEERAEEEFEVCCPCGVNSDDGVMILCDGCGKWQHAVCFRIIDDDDIPQSHLCNSCAKTKVEMIASGSKVDSTLTNLTEEQAKHICLLRRAILLCLDNDLLSANIIAKCLSVESNVARGLLNRLIDEGALKDIRGRSGNKAVLKAHIEAVLIPRFFTTVQPSPQVEHEEKDDVEKLPSTSRGKRGRVAEINDITSATEDLEISNDFNVRNIVLLSQESMESPRPSKRRRNYNTVNTPIPIAPR